MINLKSYQNIEEIKSLLAECMMPDDERIVQELIKYNETDSRILLGDLGDQELKGIIGIIRISEDDVELKHIAVKTKFRKQGIGREMIYEYIQKNGIRRMTAETDKDAVIFYKKIGFEITSLGEKYPGIERFKCILSVFQEDRNFT